MSSGRKFIALLLGLLIVGLNAEHQETGRVILWAVTGTTVNSYRLYRADSTDSPAPTLVAEGPASLDRLIQVRDTTPSDQSHIYWLEITDTSGRMVRASLSVQG